MDCKEKCDLDTSPTNASIAASLVDPITNVTTSAALVSDSGVTLVTAESTTIPVTTPVTRRKKRVNHSKAELIKAADGNLTCTVTSSGSEDNNRSEVVISIKSESADTFETETLAPPETQNYSSTPPKHRLKIENLPEPIPEKRARSSKSEAKTSPDLAPSSTEKFRGAHTVSKKMRKKSKEVSATFLSPELKGNEYSGNIFQDLSNSELNLTENYSVISDSKESVNAETLESPKEDGQSPTRGKNVRNPYGRRGKPGKRSVTAIQSTMKSKESKVSATLPTKTKVDPSEAEAVRPEWLKPFKEGWRREIVFRNAAADATGGRKCDIYYFTPDSCKLRSTPQIVSYLSKQKSDLTSSCFTFVKRMIYMEPGEFVRNASRRSDITTSTKPAKPQKRKAETESGNSEIAPTSKPSLKLKLKRQKLKNSSLMKVKIVLSPRGSVANDGMSAPIPVVDFFKEEPHSFHSTPISATETQSLVDSLPSLLDVNDSSQWKLMKPKKIFRKKGSAALPKSVKNEDEQVAEAGEEAYPPPEMPRETMQVSSTETTLLPTVDTNQSANNTLPSTVENQGSGENDDNKDNENAKNRDNENTENEDNENAKNKDNEKIENEDNENAENKDNENIENEDNENTENIDDENDLKLSPTPKFVASVKVVDVGPARTSSKKKLTAKPVAKKSLAKRGGRLGPKVERITMLYTDGLPDKVDRLTNALLDIDANDISVTRSSGDMMPVKLTVGSKTSPPSPTDNQTEKLTDDREYYDPSYNPVSEIRRCGLHCAGRYGMAPSLHCDICMCMFHPECVDITHVPHRTSFTCQACYSLNADFSGSNSFCEKTVSPNSRPIPPPPTPPSGRPGDRLNTLDAWSSSSSVPLSNSSLGVFLSSFTLPPPVGLALSASNGSSSVVQKVSVSGIDRANPSGRVLSLPRSLLSLLNLSRPVTLSFNGQKYSVPGSCFMVTPDSVRVVLPNHIFKNSPAPMTSVPSNVLLSSAQPSLNPDESCATNISAHGRDLDALQMMPSSEASSKASPSSERNCEMQSSREATRGNDSSDRLQGVEQSTHNGQRRPGDDETMAQQLTTETNDSGNEVVMDVSGNDVDCGVDEKNKWKRGSCAFQWIGLNVQLMILHIFKRLNIVGLLNASRVCTEWRRISEDSSLWKNVNLSGVKVIDWNLAAEQMTKHQTKSLDLCRLVHCGSENQTWHQLTAAFSSLTTVRCLVFGPCPANLVYVAASKMTDLESLKAKEIVDVGGESSANSQTPVRLRNTKLDVGRMAVLRNLVHLELRGSHGLILPAFSFSGGLTELAQLTQLKHLSITSLRDVPGKEFHFLNHLKNLEVLDIGDCKLWTKENYEHLGRLTQLKRLKLECVMDSQETGLGLAVASLSRLEHLELSCYRISKSSADSLSTMFHLKALHLLSETCEEAASSNSYALTAVKSMKFLSELTWTILSQLDRQTGPSNDDSNAGQPQPEKLLPFLLETALDRDVGGKSSAVEWKSVGELESILKEDLASSTSVSVYVATDQGTNSS